MSENPGQPITTAKELGCLKIDFHNHILPRKIPDFHQKFGYGDWIALDDTIEPGKFYMIKGGELFRVVEPNCVDVDTRLKEMDEQGVDVQVICTIPVMFSYWAKAEHTLELSRFLNDAIADVVRQHPKRFIGLGTLPMQDPALAVQELRRCVNELGFKGVQIGSHINDWNLDAPELLPFYEECEKLDCAILVHPWDMFGQEAIKKYWLPWLVGMPAETCRAVCCMIFGGIFERFPKLRVCFGHGGGSFPLTIGRIEHGFHCRPDLVQVECKVNPREYIGKSIWVDSILHDHNALNFVVNTMGEDFVLFGTDYPFPLGEVTPWSYPGKLIESSSLPRETKIKLLETNVLNFLRLKREAFL